MPLHLEERTFRNPIVCEMYLVYMTYWYPLHFNPPQRLIDARNVILTRQEWTVDRYKDIIKQDFLLSLEQMKNRNNLPHYRIYTLE